MKNNNKLARNAIRARKAQKKRANEQDKPKKGKRWFSRLFALIGCLLLVSALALPCFADEPAETATVTVPLSLALELFDDMLDDRSNNDAYSYLNNYYDGLGYESFFNKATLVSGVTDIRNNADYSVTVPLGVSTSNNNQNSVSVSSQIPLEVFSFAIFTTLGSNPAYIDINGLGYINVSFYYENNNSMVELWFYAQNEQLPLLTFRYNGVSTVNGIEYKLSNVSANGASYTPSQLAKVETSYTLQNGATPYLLPFVTALLYNRDIADYNDVVYSPRDFYYGINSAYNLGYADGQRYGLQDAYDRGYEDGYEFGYNTGYNDGLDQTVTESAAYQAGYDKAVSEIDSGEFGANFLGALFSTPIKALREFVIVDLPDGNSITLMGVFSAALALILLIAFMRKFAGN